MTADKEALDRAVADLRARIVAAQRARGRAEQARDGAQAHADTARTQLRETFGVGTVEEGRQLLNELESELRSAIAQLGAALDEIGV